MNKAIFLDRDGTLIEDKKYIRTIYDVSLLPGVVEALELFIKNNFLLIVVSNQSGVGRGFFYEKTVESINNFIQQKLLIYNISISKFYFCPHYLGSENSKYNIKCNCRKPSPGLILQATYDFNIDLSKSYMFGDKSSDVLAGYKAGVKENYLVDSKYNLLFYANNIVMP